MTSLANKHFICHSSGLVMKGVAGYGIGGALALHIATCYALGSFPIQIRAVVGGELLASQ